MQPYDRDPQGVGHRLKGPASEPRFESQGGVRWAPRRGATRPGYSHEEASLAERRGVRRALGITTLILAVEVVGGWWSGSLALLSDAGHMLTDASALALALLAIRFAARPATLKRTYGYYRLEILSALLNGTILVGIAGAIWWEAWQRLGTQVAVHTPVMMGVAAVGLVANLGSLYFLHGHQGLNVRGAFIHVLSDTLSSVAVLIAGAVMYFTDLHIIDPILSALIGGLIVVSAWKLVRESLDVLLESVPAGLDHSDVCAAISEVAGVEAVHDVHIWAITSGMVSLSAHVVVDSTHAHDNDAILGRIKTALKERFHIEHTTIQIETEEYVHTGEAVC